MFTIYLHNLTFHAYHGVYEEERLLGNDFIVNVTVTFVADEPVTSLHQTVNYVSVYNIVKQRMAIALPLLETLAQELTQEIYDFDNRIKSIAVSIEKKNPPLSNMEGSVSVHFKKEY